MKLSIVSTLYKTADCLSEFHARITVVAQELTGQDYELILVNDGSPDKSLEISLSLLAIDNNLKIIDLSRNFGHHKAMMTGLMHSEGDLVFLIDSDLEEAPEYLIPFAKKFKEEACDVVYGVQNQRKGTWFERSAGAVFWKILASLSELDLQLNQITARLMSRRYVDSLISHREREIFITGLWSITGYKQIPHVVSKRDTGKTTYTLYKKIALCVNAIASFTNAPLVGIFYIGIFIFSVACICGSYLVFRWAFFSAPLAGWTSLIISVWILGGLVISMTGILGIYLSKVFSEVKQRPNVIIKDIYGSK